MLLHELFVLLPIDDFLGHRTARNPNDLSSLLPLVGMWPLVIIKLCAMLCEWR